MNDNPPSFGAPSYSFSLLENQISGTIFGFVDATDLDSGINQQLMFLVAVPSLPFTFSGDALQTTEPLDRETRFSYTFEVSYNHLCIDNVSLSTSCVDICC